MVVAASLGSTVSSLAPRIETVCGNPTEVVRVGGGPLRLVFVPGNPGIASFYGSTAAALSESLDASAAVIGFRGHTLNPLLSPTRAFDLEQQVDHVAGFLEGELSASGEADLVVVGHSIGAWVALEAVRRLGANQRRVTACLGLMPYLATETEDAGRKAVLIRQWFAPALIWLLAGVAQLIGWLPVRAWRMAALRFLEPEISGYDPDQREIAEMSLPRFGTLLNILTLFRAEARNHASPYDFSRLDGFRDRVCLLVSPGDPWCCSESAGGGAAAGLAVHRVAGLPHAFGTQRASRTAVVAWLTTTVRKLRGGGGARGGAGVAPGVRTAASRRASRSPART